MFILSIEAWEEVACVHFSREKWSPESLPSLAGSKQASVCPLQTAPCRSAYMVGSWL